MKTIRELGELGLIDRIARRLPPRHAIAGIGDDCAVLPASRPGCYLLFASDPVVENVHYLPSTPPGQVGWKALGRNLSDIAAMGGRPRWAVVSLGLHPDTPIGYVDRLYGGLGRLARRFHCEIVGGDTSHVPANPFVVVTVIGEVPRDRLVRRRGARSSDAIVVTGRLGGARHGKHLRFTPRVTEAEWLTRQVRVHAMIDISDGLARDLHNLHRATRQNVRFEIQAGDIPLARAARGQLDAALGDGEDFELLFTIRRADLADLQRRWRRRFKIPLTEIGRVRRGPGPAVTMVHPDGATDILPPAGYDHFTRH